MGTLKVSDQVNFRDLLAGLRRKSLNIGLQEIDFLSSAMFSVSVVK